MSLLPCLIILVGVSPSRWQGLGSFVKHLNMTGGQPSMLDLLSALSDATGVTL